MTQPLWKYKDVADYLRCTTRHLIRLVNENRIPHRILNEGKRQGRMVRFLPDEIEAWVRQNPPENTGSEEDPSAE